MISLCPHCRRKLRIDDRYVGVERTCPACGEVFTVPRPIAHDAAGRNRVADTASVGGSARPGGTAVAEPPQEVTDSRGRAHEHGRDVWSDPREAPEERPSDSFMSGLDHVYRELDRAANKVSLCPDERVVGVTKGLLGRAVRNPLLRLIVWVWHLGRAVFGTRVVCFLYMTNQRLIFNNLGTRLFGIWGRSRVEHSIPLDGIACFGWSSDTWLIHLLRTYNLEVHSKAGVAFVVHLSGHHEDKVRGLVSKLNQLVQAR